jgi:hypothetical protein
MKSARTGFARQDVKEHGRRRIENAARKGFALLCWLMISYESVLPVQFIHWLMQRANAPIVDYVRLRMFFRPTTRSPAERRCSARTTDFAQPVYRNIDSKHRNHHPVGR